MRDQYYSDKHDLVKWAILYQLAKYFSINRIIQIAFYRLSKFPEIIIDEREYPISHEVKAHFRDVRKVCNINSKIRINVFDVNFKDRKKYLDAVKLFLSSFHQERCIVFLDPDTGLEPEHPGLEHVRSEEAAEIWKVLKPGDVYTFYQHRNSKGNWINYMKSRLEQALHLTEDNLLKIAHIKIKPGKTPNVAFFYVQKPVRGQLPPKEVEPLSKPTNKMKCPCGCDEIPEWGVFMPGHDGRICGFMRRMEKGEAKPEDFKEEVRQIYGEWVKQGRPGGDFHCKIKKIVEKIRRS